MRAQHYGSCLPGKSQWGFMEILSKYLNFEMRVKVDVEKKFKKMVKYWVFI